MNNLMLFKQGLEQHLEIVEWSPTEYQLLQILNKIEGKFTKEEVLKVVFEIYGEDILFSCLEGVDNSDSNTLLLLAMKVRTNGDK